MCSSHDVLRDKFESDVRLKTLGGMYFEDTDAQNEWPIDWDVWYVENFQHNRLL